MKKILIGLAIAAVAFSAAVAGEDTTGLGYIDLMNSSFTNRADLGYATVGTLTNGFDISKYKGRAKLILTASGDLATTASPTNNSAIVLQHGGSVTGAWSNVSGASLTPATTGTFTTVNLDLGSLKKCVRVAVKLLGTNVVQQTVTGVFVLPRLSD